MAVHVAAWCDGDVREGLHADDAGALADALGTGGVGGGCLGLKELSLLGLGEFFFGGGGFVSEVELFDGTAGGVSGE